MPGAPLSAGTTRPESSASAGNPLASAAALAFSPAFASKLSPLSSGSGRPSEDAAIVSTPNGASKAAISSILPGLWLPITSRWPTKPRTIGSAEPECGPLMPSELRDPQPGQAQHLAEEGFVERRGLGGRLDLDDPSSSGQHEIGVGHGLRIFSVIEIEHRGAGNHAAGDCRDAVAQRHRGNDTPREQAVECLVKRHVTAGHGGRASAAICPQDVAVEFDLALAEPGQIGDGAQAAADQPLDLLRAPALPAARRLAVGARL